MADEKPSSLTLPNRAMSLNGEPEPIRVVGGEVPTGQVVMDGRAKASGDVPAQVRGSTRSALEAGLGALVSIFKRVNRAANGMSGGQAAPWRVNVIRRGSRSERGARRPNTA
jgi:hypothetical protein